METTSRPKSFVLPYLNHGSRNSSISNASLPRAAYDGSHLSWQDFRSNVLAPYGIHIIGQPPKNRLPYELWKLIELRGQNTTRFDAQKKEFRAQVSTGHGFGPSPLFPPNLLPPLDNTSGLARCMIPRFRRDPLPQRAPEQQGSSYELSVPHPGLGCGFTQHVFDSQEFSMLPHYLSLAGTNVNFETGYVSSHASIHCPFLTFERAQGPRHEQLETANNRCAIAGAWCVRASHMLFNKAYKATVIPDLPAAFSCIIDNSFAILNYHWIDHTQEFYMAPLCKFDLKNDAHFTQFLVWIEAIGDWGLRYHLPKIKAALSRLIQFSPTPTVTAIPSLTLSPMSNSSSESGIVRALRTTFDSIPWRVDDGEYSYTPLSSSTADWGSPQNLDNGFTPVSRTSTHSWGSPCDDAIDFPYPSGPNISLRNVKLERRGLNLSMGSKPGPKLVTSPPPSASDPTTAIQTRFNEAQDEIRDLKAQLQQQRAESEASVAALRNEIASVKEIVFSLLRKENMRSRARSLSMPSSPQTEHWLPVQDQVSAKVPAQIKTQVQSLAQTEEPVDSESEPTSPLQAEILVGLEAGAAAESESESEADTETETETEDDCESETLKTPKPKEDVGHFIHSAREGQEL
jgi:hypothetical protein